MQKVMLYDIEAEKLEQLAEANDTTVAEIVEQLVEYLPEVKEFNGWK